jgi:predicted Zn-dependent protease
VAAPSTTRRPCRGALFAVPFPCITPTRTLEEHVTAEARIEALRRMMAAHPDDPRPRFGLALEYERAERWEDAVDTLRAYLERADDEGNAWGRLGAALRQLGRDDEAREAYQLGIDAATRHAHPTMAGEFEDILDDF